MRRHSGAGVPLNTRDEPPAASVSGEPPEEENRDGQIQISSREKAPATTVSVTGGEKLTFPQVYKANVDSCVSINVSSTKVGYNIFGQPVQREAVSSGSGFFLPRTGILSPTATWSAVLPAFRSRWTTARSTAPRWWAAMPTMTSPY